MLLYLGPRLHDAAAVPCVYRCSTEDIAHQSSLEMVSDSACRLRNGAHDGHQTLIDVCDIGSQDLPDTLLIREACHNARTLRFLSRP